jgi:hypothetical protein
MTGTSSSSAPAPSERPTSSNSSRIPGKATRPIGVTAVAWPAVSNRPFPLSAMSVTRRLPSGSVRVVARPVAPFGGRLLPGDLRQEHGGEPGAPMGGEHRRGGVGAAEQIVGQDGNEGRAREMVAGTQQGVAQTLGMVLGHELEVERPLVAPGHHLEQRLVRIGHHDGPQQSGAGRLVQRPVQHRPERHREHFLGKPAGDRVEAGPEPPHGMTAVSRIICGWTWRRVSCTPGPGGSRPPAGERSKVPETSSRSGASK